MVCFLASAPFLDMLRVWIFSRFNEVSIDLWARDPRGAGYHESELARASRADAAESVGMANQATAGPTVALGVLSSAGSAGTATTSDYVYRRTTVREGLRGFDPSVLQRVAVRFLLAGTEVTKPHSNNVKELRMAREENRTHGDMIFLDMCDLCHRWRCRRPKCLPSLLYISGHSTC